MGGLRWQQLIKPFEKARCQIVSLSQIFWEKTLSIQNLHLIISQHPIIRNDFYSMYRHSRDGAQIRFLFDLCICQHRLWSCSHCTHIFRGIAVIFFPLVPDCLLAPKVSQNTSEHSAVLWLNTSTVDKWWRTAASVVLLTRCCTRWQCKV